MVDAAEERTTGRWSAPLSAARFGLVLAMVLTVAPGAAPRSDVVMAQELPVRATVERPSIVACPAGSMRAILPDGEGAPADGDDGDSLERRVEAARLAASAAEATEAGRLARAQELLEQAFRLDPESHELALRLARVYEAQETEGEALGWYCAYLEMAPDGTQADTVRARTRSLAEAGSPRIDSSALAAFRQGVEALVDEDPSAAEEHFTRALRSEPDLPEAFYNRGLARGAAGRPGLAVADLQAYLGAREDVPDRARVEAAIGYLEREEKRYDPSSALVLGALVPGAGHFYTGQPLRGGLLLGAAVGAGLTAALYQKVEVRCRVSASEGVCPEDQVHSTVVERPALVPGLAAAGLAAAVSAFTAYRAADARNDGARRRLRIAPPPGGTEGVALRLLQPAAAASPGGSALALLHLQF